MFKKALTFIIVIELAVCVYLLAFCRPTKPVYVQVKPSDKACYDYVNRENMAWLKSLEKTKRNKDAY